MKNLFVSGLFFVFSAAALAQDSFKIGTGGVSGIYYPTVEAICGLVNKHGGNGNSVCKVESTAGSVYNLDKVLAGGLDFGIAQSDVIYQAYTGTEKFAGKPQKTLRAIMTIYPELLALIVDKKAGISVLEDIKGKRINIGNPGSGNEATTMIVLEEAGLRKADLALAGGLKAQECPAALKAGKIDGYFYMVGHPAANLREAANSLPVDLLQIDGRPVYNMLEKYPYYSKGVIPGGLYKGITDDVPTVGVKAVLTATDKTADDKVLLILKSVLEHFEEFKKIHPGPGTVTKEELLHNLSAPLHPAAEKYYRETGLIK